MKEDFKKLADTIKNNKFIFVVGLLCVCIPPLLFTGNLFFTCGPDYTKEGIGQIGDVIGGTTAPFIGLLGAILIYISFQQQVKANQQQVEANKCLEKGTKTANFFKEYDTIVDLIDFTKKQYEILLEEKKEDALDTLLHEDNPDILKLEKYRCVLELVSQCCDSIAKFEEPEEMKIKFSYKNQLRVLFNPYYYLYYRAIFKTSLTILDIDVISDRWDFKYKGNTISIVNIKEKDAYLDDDTKVLKDKMSIYFIAIAIKNIIDAMENRNSDDYYEFRGIPKTTDDK
jgi:hypothetical protein